jgi:crossover junction endodeoxyribonuclease RuvC
MKILGIDPSTKMGLVVLEHSMATDIVTTLHQECYSSKQKEMPRLGDIGARVFELCEEHKPDLVALEGYSFGSKFNHEIMYSIGTVLRYFLWQWEYTYKIIPPTTLKKFVTGKGNSKKDLMMLGVFKNWGFETSDDNVADAYALALCCLFQHLGKSDEKGVWKKGDAKYIVYDHSKLPDSSQN